MTDAWDASSLGERQAALLTRSIAIGKKVKADHVRSVHGKRGRTDIMTVVTGFRGEQPVVYAHHPPHRDFMLYLAHVFAGAMALDAISVVNETWNAKSTENPVTGKHWGPGEMNEVVEHHRGLEKGWVGEGLLFNVVGRDGALHSATLGYEIQRRIVAWDEELTTASTGVELGGYVVDKLKEAMERPTILNAMAGMDLPPLLDPDDALQRENRQAMMDCAAVKFLYGNMDAVPNPPPVLMLSLVAEPGSERARYIEESFKDTPDAKTVPPDWLDE